MKTIIITIGILGIISCGRNTPDFIANKKNEEGHVLLNSGKVEQAILLYTEASQVKNVSKKNKGEAYQNISSAYAWHANVDSMLKYSHLALNCYDEGGYWYMINSIDIDIHTKNITQALSKLNSMDEEDYFVQNLLGLIYLGDYGDEHLDADRALKHNKKAFKMKGNRISEDVLARNYMILGDFQKSRSHYEKLLNQYPDNPEILFQLGKVEYLDENIELAEKYFNKITDKNPKLISLVNWFKNSN